MDLKHGGYQELWNELARLSALLPMAHIRRGQTLRAPEQKNRTRKPVEHTSVLTRWFLTPQRLILARMTNAANKFRHRGGRAYRQECAVRLHRKRTAHHVTYHRIA